MKIKVLILFITCISPLLFHAQDTNSRLILSEIMAGNDFIGAQPDNISWSPDNQHFYFSWGTNQFEENQWYEYDINTKKYKSLDEHESDQIPTRGLMTDDNKKHWYFRNKNDIIQTREGKPEKIFSFYGRYSLEKVLQNGSLILTISDQIVEFNPQKGTLIQLIRMVDPAEPEAKGYLEDQQRELFEIIKKREDQSNEREDLGLPVIVKTDALTWFEIDDKKQSILFQVSDYPKTEQTQYASYLTQNGVTTLKEARPKVGRPDPSHSLHLVNMDSNVQYKIDISGLSGINDAPDYFKYYADQEALEEKSVVYHNHGSNPEGTLFLIEIKSFDNKDRWICTVDHQGHLNELDHQRDTAWIGGPGISGWTSVGGNVGWINNSTVYYQSEQSGYSHLYSYDLNKEKPTQLTTGKFEVHGAILSKSRDKFYVTANHNHPGNREFYELDIKTKMLKGILTMAGNHQVSISPDETQIAVRYSYINRPWEVYHAPLKPSTTLEQVTDSRSTSFKSYDWREPAVINFEASDGKNLYARLYIPEEADKNGAGVIFVHGAGYLQNAHNWWSGYYREYMFHNLLVDLGYMVLDIDYRASKGYGRDHRTAIYRHMGGMDLSDQIDGRQFLIDTYKLDPERIGIYGGSYGGFITLMALLQHPGKFKCGAALRSVTDWAHYNHPYTSNILNTPETDPRAFKMSSPIYFAENLEDRLIMLHGIEDDNVQYQDVVRLSQRFIELGKENWDLTGYPVERHGFKETSSWTDEYGRILKMFEEELQKK